MKPEVLSLLGVLTVCAVITIVQAENFYWDIGNGKNTFEDYIKEYNKVYKDEADKQKHFLAFMKKLNYLNSLIDLNPDKRPVFDLNNDSDRIEE